MLFVRKECQDKLPCRYLLLDGGRAASWRADHEDTEQGYTLPNPHLKNTEKTEGERECMRVCVREREIRVCRVLFKFWGHFVHRNASTHQWERHTGNEHMSPHASWGPARPFFDGMRVWISPALPRQRHVSKPWRLIFIKKVKVMEIIRLFLNRGAPRPPGEIPPTLFFPRVSSQINPDVRLTSSNLSKRRCWQRMPR